jgi:hypothetical protein
LKKRSVDELKDLYGTENQLAQSALEDGESCIVRICARGLDGRGIPREPALPSNNVTNTSRA